MEPSTLFTLYISVLVLGIFVDVLVLGVQAAHLARLRPSQVGHVTDAAQLRSAANWNAGLAVLAIAVGSVFIGTYAWLVTTGRLAEVYTAVLASVRSEVLAVTTFLVVAQMVFEFIRSPLVWWRVRSKSSDRPPGGADTVVRDVLQRTIEGGLAAALGVPAVLTVHAWLGSTSWIVVLIAPFAIEVLMRIVQPVMRYLFGEPSRLPNGSLRSAIEDELAEASFDLADAEVVDDAVQRRDFHVDVDGFGRQKRVSIGESLVEHLSPREVRALVSREVELGGERTRFLLGLADGTLGLGVKLVLVVLLLDSPSLSAMMGSSEVAVGLNIMAIILLDALLIPGGILTLAVARALQRRALRRMARSPHAATLARLIRRNPRLPTHRVSAHPIYKWFNLRDEPVDEQLRLLRVDASPSDIGISA